MSLIDRVKDVYSIESVRFVILYVNSENAKRQISREALNISNVQGWIQNFNKGGG